MQDLKSILVCTDFSKEASNALVYAINLADQINAHLYVLHVKTTSGQVLEDDAIEDNFEQIRHDYMFRRTVRTSFLIRVGLVPEEIKSTIEDKKVDVVILGMKGASGLHEIKIGSITAHLITDTSCSIISVPKDCRILTFKEMALAMDSLESPNKSELYVISFLAEVFNPKVHIFTVQENKKREVKSEDERKKKSVFGDIFKYNTSSFYKINESDIVSSIKDFGDKHNIDLLVVFHRVDKQKDPFKRSISKQLAFSLKLPLLICPVNSP
ncbi:universal stress protein [Fulvivirga sp. M361]|uniref:universal stress protein n=1 Tax=Fulvivirga sp. M361 TaxID=2594266 RepID=UPI00117AC44A|nr:universal stress protein [Fulvivirga sp. M361]TRX52679.1 universal stress protein [Fulvivirga sp. M361]